MRLVARLLNYVYLFFTMLNFIWDFLSDKQSSRHSNHDCHYWLCFKLQDIFFSCVPEKILRVPQVMVLFIAYSSCFEYFWMQIWNTASSEHEQIMDYIDLLNWDWLFRWKFEINKIGRKRFKKKKKQCSRILLIRIFGWIFRSSDWIGLFVNVCLKWLFVMNDSFKDPIAF